MKRKNIILTIILSFIIGFAAGITTVIVKSKMGSKEPMTYETVSSPLSQEPLSIELMEKIEDLREVVRENPKDFKSWRKLGNIYFEHHRYRESLETYNQYLTLKPDDPDIRTNLGIVLKMIGDDDGAVEEFRKAAQGDPKHSHSRYQLGLILFQDKKNNKEAINAWEDFLKVEPKGERANQVKVLLERLKEEWGKK